MLLDHAAKRVQTPSICFSGAKLSTCWPAHTKHPPPPPPWGALMEADGCHSGGAPLANVPRQTSLHPASSEQSADTLLALEI